MSWAVLHCKITVKTKIGTAAEAYLELCCVVVGRIEEGCHGPHGGLISCVFKVACNCILSVLQIYPAIFSHIGHTAMAADAPNLHMGDLGRLEEVRNALIGTDINGHRESTK